MSYRSILVHACETAWAQSRYRLAAAIARAENAQLAGIAASGASELAYRCSAASAMAAIEPGDFSFLTESARRDLDAFGRAVAGLDVTLANGALSDELAAGALPLGARFCDLLVIGQSRSPDALIGDDHSLARSVLLHAPCPVLVVPADAPAAALPHHPLLAWDGSMAASRAVRGALPLLRRTGRVTVASFHPQKFSAASGGGDAGTALATYLACHGIDATLTGTGHAADVGHALLALAAAGSHDLIVMGSFGHSRLRDIVLGGVTRTVLAETGIPVLMCR
jgi:nucleotide-binding universal stress UspA family protein